ncbi:MAG: hypothetical protein ACI9WS_000799 [Paraglaciecola psychrophila]|jgi:hypothetical protein
MVFVVALSSAQGRLQKVFVIALAAKIKAAISAVNNKL